VARQHGLGVGDHDRVALGLEPREVVQAVLEGVPVPPEVGGEVQGAGELVEERRLRPAAPAVHPADGEARQRRERGERIAPGAEDEQLDVRGVDGAQVVGQRTHRRAGRRQRRCGSWAEASGSRHGPGF
jgi:hypothetical protein